MERNERAPYIPVMKKRIGLTLLLVLAAVWAGPLAYSAVRYEPNGQAWHEASRASAGLAPSAAEDPRAIVQVYAAPTFGWRGIFAVHSWIAVKPAGPDGRWTRWDVMRWGGGGTVKTNRERPDARWYGAEPRLLRDVRGPEAAALIPRIRAAVAAYPYDHWYRTFPGPNSNTFVASVARAVPELGLDLPANAIGKDWLPWTAPLATPPGGQGVQLSVEGMLGVLVGAEEGVEVNLLGLSFGVDWSPWSLRLPGIGQWPEVEGGER